MTADHDPDPRVAELQAAFADFGSATAALEREYRRLQEHARGLRAELEEKKRALTASIERQRCLETQALRQSRLAAMGEMAATLAHEVRNPLGTIELFSRMLVEEVHDRPEARRLAEQVVSGVADLNHVVGNMLEYTRLPEPSRAALDLEELLDDALLTAAATLGPGIRIERRRGAPTRWWVDRGLLGQVLLNLIRNAAEAMEGEGTLRLGIEASARWARIAVADSGPGVPAESAEAIFAPFFTTKARGTGLGLAVSRAAVAAHGGTLALRPGAPGAMFVVTLPRVDAAGRPLATDETQEHDDHAAAAAAEEPRRAERVG